MLYQTHISNLTKAELSQEIIKNLKQERSALVRFLVCLAEIDERKLFVDDGYSSLFSYLTRGLNFSPACAQKRSQVCRLARRFPLVLQAIERGELNLSGASIIAGKMTEENVSELLLSVAGKNCDEIAWIATKYERKVVETVASSVGEKFMPLIFCVPSISEDKPACEISHSPITPETFQLETDRRQLAVPINKIKPQNETSATVSFSCSKELVDKISRAKDLLGTNQLETIFTKAIEALLDKQAPERRATRREKREEKKKVTLLEDKAAETQQRAAEIKPLPYGTTGTHDEAFRRKALPLSVKDQVLKKYNYSCAYKNSHGMRCAERKFLEIDHIKPVGCLGSNDFSNLRPLCRAHNQYFARLVYGEEKMLKYGS